MSAHEPAKAYLKALMPTVKRPCVDQKLCHIAVVVVVEGEEGEEEYIIIVVII